MANKSNAFQLFDIKDDKHLYDITIEDLRKRYHKLCLKFHPDKHNHKYDHTNFVNLQENYLFLLELKENHKKKDMGDNSNNDFDYKLYVYDFLVELFQSDRIQPLIDFLFLQNREQKQECVINYFISLDQLFNKDLYYNREYNVYVPLWHKYISLKSIYKTLNVNMDDIPNPDNIIFIMKVHDLPQNISITDENDIICIVEKEMLHESIILVEICEKKKLEVIINDTIRSLKFHVILHEGIPKPNSENTYDISVLSNIILVFR